MKNDWQTKKLGEICEVVGGGTPETSNKKYWDGDLCWVTPKDLGKLDGFEISKTERRISNDGLKNSSAKLLPVGSVILSSRAPIGYVFINTVEMATNQGCKSFICGPDLYNKYLYYFLISNVEYLNSLGSGTTFKEVSGSVLKFIDIKYPPPSEQKRVVKKLDEIFEKVTIAKENAERNLKNSRQLFESYLNNIFQNPDKGWKYRVLGEICIFENGDRGKNYPAKSKLYLNGIPFVTAGNLNNFDIELKGKNYLSDMQYKLLSRGKFSKGDILFCLRGSLGKFALVKSVEYGAIASSLMIVRPKSEIVNNFLFYYFQSGLCKDMIKKYKGGTAQPNLGAQDVKKFNIFIPSLDEQKQVIKKLDKIYKQTKKLEFIYQNKLDDLEQLKKSVLSKAFKGEL